MGFSRLQGFGPRCLPWHEYHCLPGFVPFQRHHQDHATAGIPAPVLPAPRFSQPLSGPTSPWLAGLFHPAGTPRVRPSELDPRSIGARFPALAPSPLATSQGFHPAAHSALIHGSTPTPLRVMGSCAVAGSSHPCGCRLPSQASPDLEAFCPIWSAPSRPAVSPASRRSSSPGLPAFRAFSESHLGPFGPTLAGFEPPQGLLVVSVASPPCGGACPPGVCTLWPRTFS